MALIEEIIVHGTLEGGLLALLAIGFTLIYGVANVVNMAHGALFMTGAYIFWFLTTSEFFGLPYKTIELDVGPALLIAVILTAIVGVIIYRLTIHPVKEDPLAPLVTTVGVLVVAEELMIIEFSSQRWHIDIPMIFGGEQYTTVLGVPVFYIKLVSFAVSLSLFIALWIFTRKTKIGTAMRAVAQDNEVAMLMGVNTERLYILTMALSASFAALAGVLYTVCTTKEAEPFMWSTPLYLAFAVVILGGIGSIKGTFLGAFVISYARYGFITLVPQSPYLSSFVALAVMVVVLLLRPKGLFGKRIEMEE